MNIKGTPVIATFRVTACILLILINKGNTIELPRSVIFQLFLILPLKLENSKMYLLQILLSVNV